MVNVMCKFDGTRSAPLFFDVSVKVFLDEVSVWIGGLSKVDGPPQCGWASSSPLRDEWNGKAEEGTFSLPG